MNLPRVRVEVVNEGAIPEPCGLAEEDSNRGAVGDRFGI
jgi:hypothetical protein